MTQDDSGLNGRITALDRDVRDLRRDFDGWKQTAIESRIRMDGDLLDVKKSVSELLHQYAAHNITQAVSIRRIYMMLAALIGIQCLDGPFIATVISATGMPDSITDLGSGITRAAVSLFAAWLIFNRMSKD